MRKKLIILMSIVVIVISICLLLNNYNIDHVIIMDEKGTTKSSSSISMMLETSAGSGMHEVSEDTSWPTSGYTFNSTLSKCENGSSLSWDSTNNQVIMTGNVSDRCYVYFDVEVSGAEALIAELYTTDGDNNLYYMDGTGTYADYEVTDYSYRFSGASSSVNNFVCFGSDSETCETDNLYRIIGFFLNDAGEYEMKLIKYDYATSTVLGTDGDYYGTGTPSSSYYQGSLSTAYYYYWNNVNSTTAYNANGGYYNDWSYSQLNTVNLNTNYYNSLDSKWQDMITTHTWIVGGGPTSSSAGVYATAKVGYSYEITSPSDQLGYTTYDAKIGLMYVSDYGFAADPSYWSVATYNYDTAAKTYDWMYMGVYEWTMSRSSSYAINAFDVDYTGDVDYNNVHYSFAVRPVLYLESSTTITSGSGTSSDPYRLT